MWDCALALALVSFDWIVRVPFDRSLDWPFLAWETETETNNYGFEIERSLDGADFETIGFMDGYGTTNSPKSYRYTDEETVNASKIAYRLKQIDRDGTFDC